MNTIQITIKDLIATAQPDAVIVSHNTGYRLQFIFDEAWGSYPVKTAVFVWYRESLPYCTSVAFEGDTVAVPQLPAVSKLYVGLTAGDLQTTTSAVISCRHSILAGGGQEPQAPTESEYAAIMELLNGKMDPVTAISVTEGADGTITMVNSIPGRTETIVLEPDEHGNPGQIHYCGIRIPISWREQA